MVALVAAWLFLLGSLLSLAFTLNAFRPSRSARLLIWSFAASMLTLELAGHHLAWQLAAAVFFIALGALDHWAGQVALVVSFVSWVGLATMLVRGRSSRETMRETLSGFCRDLRGPRVPLRHVLMPWPMRRIGIRVVRDVVYARLAGRRLKLDAYLPERSGTLRPAIMQIHGGAWIVGDKREQGIVLCMHLAANGWVAFNVNYRLSPGATFPDHLVDLKRALAWIREHADEYGVDPSFIAVTGGSAGGHLAALVALTPNDPRYQAGFEQADTSVQAAVPFYGVYDFTNRFGSFPRVFMRRLLQAHVMKAFLDEEPEKFSQASPIDQVRPDAPPFLVIHGDKDTLAPLLDARHFAERLGSISKSPALYAEIKGAQHAFDILASPRSVPVVEGVERFLHEVHQRYLEERASSADSAAREPASLPRFELGSSPT